MKPLAKVSSVTLVALGALSFAGVASAQTVLQFVGPEQPSAMEPVIAAFEAAHPDIQVEYESVPFNDLNNIIQARLSDGGTTPDIYTADQPRIAALVDRGLLADLSDQAGSLGGVMWPAAVEASSIDGQLYAMPISTSSQLLYYNIDLLEAAGIPLPSMDPEGRMTWEALAEAGAAAQAEGAQYGVVLDQINRYYQLQPLMESAGGGSGVSPDDPLVPDLVNDGWLRAMTYYHDLFDSGLGPRGVPVEQTPDLFANGQTAFFVGGPWWLPRMTGTDGLRFGIAPHPYFDGGEVVTPTGAWSWGVNPNSEHLEEAVTFVSFASTDPVGSLETARGFPIPPANMAVFDTYYSEGQEVEGVGELILHELTETARIRPPTRGYIQFEQILGQAFEDIRNGADPATALEQAQSQLERAWSRL